MWPVRSIAAMELEDALNLGLPPHHVSQCCKGERAAFRAEILGYPQCTGFGATADEAVRVARHLYTQLRDGQTAVAVTEMEHDNAERLREAMRFVVTRALV
ncbi:MAG: hypothetical protein JSR66_04200 [Proteobacteria bacterium]|nr:hypothetical protein [Pseudomonadota bacterium]